MSGFICPHCGKESHIFKSEGGRKMAEDMGVPLPREHPPGARHRGGRGQRGPFHNLESEAAPARASFSRIVETITGGSNR